jgi:hypothetical protein
VSSRTPAPDDLPSMAMPDLPTDLFDDDEPLYGYGADTRYTREPEPWDDPYVPDAGFPGYDDLDDGYIDERPRRRTRRPVDTDVEVDGPARRRRRRRRDDEYLDDDVELPRRKPRRSPRLDDLEERRPRRRQQPVDDDIYMSSVPVETGIEAPARPSSSQSPQRRRDPRQRRRQPGRQSPQRQDRVIEQPRMRMESITADIVTSEQPALRPTPQRRARRPRNPAWEWKPIVMPQWRQMLEQALPSLLMAASLFGTLGILGFMPGGLPLWAPLILIPTALLLFRSDRNVHLMWKRSAMINLVVVGAFFPMMIVRQSFLRVPFVEFGNGTLVMPILSTLMVVVAMLAIALLGAYLSQDDPEYAGMLFLPAALLVPFFAGATEITSLRTALAIIGSIYLATAVLTIIASMLPGAYPTLVAPIALALEFFVLPVSESVPIFPVGAGMSAKMLFFVVLAMGVGLTVAVPMLAVWVRQVRRIVSDTLRSACTLAPAA